MALPEQSHVAVHVGEQRPPAVDDVSDDDVIEDVEVPAATAAAPAAAPADTPAAPVFTALAPTLAAALGADALAAAVGIAVWIGGRAGAATLASSLVALSPDSLPRSQPPKPTPRPTPRHTKEAVTKTRENMARLIPIGDRGLGCFKLSCSQAVVNGSRSHRRWLYRPRSLTRVIPDRFSQRRTKAPEPSGGGKGQRRSEQVRDEDREELVFAGRVVLATLRRQRPRIATQRGARANGGARIRDVCSGQSIGGAARVGHSQSNGRRARSFSTPRA
jgi:hypothetical protein